MEKKVKDVQNRALSELLIIGFQSYITYYERFEKSPIAQAWHEHGTELIDVYVRFAQGELNPDRVPNIIRQTFGKLGYVYNQKSFDIHGIRSQNLQTIANGSEKIAHTSDDALIRALETAKPKLEVLAREYKKKKLQYLTVH